MLGNICGHIFYVFRLWPNGTEVSRYNEEDVVLSGYHIPPGTHIDLNPSVHFRDPELFPDPHTHNPDRWLRGGQAQESVATNNILASGKDFSCYIILFIL